MNIETKVRTSGVPTRLVWIDLEMTGLDTDIHRIVEVAMVITDFELKEYVRYEAVVHQPEAVLAASNEFSADMHTKNGLYERVRVSKVSEEQAQREIVTLLGEHIPQGEAVCLAGNSIRADRLFIDSQWPLLSDMLHYRMLDVSSFKLWWLGTGREPFVKGESHRALDDIVESIAELAFYLTELKR